MYTQYSVNKFEELSSELEEHKSVIFEMRELFKNLLKSKYDRKNEFLRKRPRCEEEFKYNCYLYSHDSEHFEILNNSAVYRSLNKDTYTYLFLNHDLTNTIRWRISGDLSSTFSLGVCMKELVTHRNFKFTPMTHSSFLLSMNGFTWNTNNEAENNHQINLRKNEKYNSVEVKYSHSNRSLTYYVNNEKVLTLTNVSPNDGYSLVPCCVFKEDGDEIIAEINDYIN
jgi:hypothetical protein